MSADPASRLAAFGAALRARFAWAGLRARPIRGGVGLLIAAAIGVGVWRLSVAPEPRTSVDSSPRVAAAEGVAPPAESVVPQATLPAPPTRGPVASAPGEDEIEVCGVGWVPAAADGAPDEAVLRADPGLVEARERLLSNLRTSRDPYARAVGAWLEGPADTAHTAAHLDALARLASVTADPGVYALAFGACLATPGEGSCALLSAGQWARLDDGNALPWLHLFDQARARGDDAGRDEALYRMSVARRYEDRRFGPAATIAARAGASDADALAAERLALEALGRAAAQSVPSQPLLQHCRGAALGDANRSQVCGAVARVMVERSESLSTRSIGAALDYAVTQDPALRDRVSQDLAEAQRDPGLVSLQSPGCAATRRALDYFRRAAQAAVRRTRPPRAARRALRARRCRPRKA